MSNVWTCLSLPRRRHVAWLLRAYSRQLISRSKTTTEALNSITIEVTSSYERTYVVRTWNWLLCVLRRQNIHWAKLDIDIAYWCEYDLYEFTTVDELMRYVGRAKRHQLLISNACSYSFSQTDYCMPVIVNTKIAILITCCHNY